MLHGIFSRNNSGEEFEKQILIMTATHDGFICNGCVIFARTNTRLNTQGSEGTSFGNTTIRCMNRVARVRSSIALHRRWKRRCFFFEFVLSVICIYMTIQRIVRHDVFLDPINIAIGNVTKNCPIAVKILWTDTKCIVSNFPHCGRISITNGIESHTSEICETACSCPFREHQDSAQNVGKLAKNHTTQQNEEPLLLVC